MLCSLELPKALDKEQEWPETKPHKASYLQQPLSRQTLVSAHFYENNSSQQAGKVQFCQGYGKDKNI